MENTLVSMDVNNAQFKYEHVINAFLIMREMHSTCFGGFFNSRTHTMSTGE